MIPKATIVHQIKNRTRIQIPSRKNSTLFFTQAKEVLSRCGGVKKVESNPLSGTLLFLYHNNFDEIVSYAKLNKLFEIEKQTNAINPDTPRKPLFERISEFDQMIQKSTQGKWNMNTLSAKLL